LGRPRLHRDDAARQASYRKRKAARVAALAAENVKLKQETIRLAAALRRQKLER
jgi:hypothetical protein